MTTDDYQNVTTSLVTRQLFTDAGIITVEGPVSSESLSQFSICDGLCHFRQSREQFQALKDIANLPEGLVFVAHIQGIIVGYITFLYPEFERWAQAGMPSLLELGAIEISKNWRNTGIATALVQIPFTTTLFEDKIIVSLECYWFWDTQGKKLNTWEYRKMLEVLFAKGGFVTKVTDDPDICSHPANLLSVRIGSLVSPETRSEFESVCYRGKTLICI